MRVNRLMVGFGFLLLFLLPQISRGFVQADPLPAQCFTTDRKLVGSLYSDTETIISKLPSCAKDAAEMATWGFAVTELPADFPKPGDCYLWPKEGDKKSGKKIDCNDPVLKGAIGFGDASQVPPPPGTPTPTPTSPGGGANGTSTGGGCVEPTPAPKTPHCKITSSGFLEAGKDTGDLTKIAAAAIVFLSYLVGIVVVGMLVVAGIRYSSAGGDPNAVAMAKKMIFNAVFALIAFIFLRALLNWLTPGGVG